MKLITPENESKEAQNKATNDAMGWMISAFIAAHYASGGPGLTDQEIASLPELALLRDRAEEVTSPREIGEFFAEYRKVRPYPKP